MYLSLARSACSGLDRAAGFLGTARVWLYLCFSPGVWTTEQGFGCRGFESVLLPLSSPWPPSSSPSHPSSAFSVIRRLIFSESISSPLLLSYVELFDFAFHSFCVCVVALVFIGYIFNLSQSVFQNEAGSPAGNKSTTVHFPSAQDRAATTIIQFASAFAEHLLVECYYFCSKQPIIF